MGLYGIWKNKLDAQEASEQDNAFFEGYLKKETEAYKSLLAAGALELKGTVSALAERFGMDHVTFAGFLDGANESLVSSLNLDADDLTPETELDLSFDKKKLYYNMLGAKAKWLYELPEWNGNLSEEERADVRRQFASDNRAVSSKVGRNDPCPCGSGKKYKKCCGA